MNKPNDGIIAPHQNETGNPAAPREANENCDCSVVKAFLWEIMHQEFSSEFVTPLSAHLADCPECTSESLEMTRWIEKIQICCHQEAPIELRERIIMRIRQAE